MNAVTLNYSIFEVKLLYSLGVVAHAGFVDSAVTAKRRHERCLLGTNAPLTDQSDERILPASHHRVFPSVVNTPDPVN